MSWTTDDSWDSIDMSYFGARKVWNAPARPARHIAADDLCRHPKMQHFLGHLQVNRPASFFAVVEFEQPPAIPVPYERGKRDTTTIDHGGYIGNVYRRRED